MDTCIAWQGGGCSIFTFLDHFKRQNHPSEHQQEWRRERILEDEARVEQLLPESVEWFKSKAITRPTREEMRTYLVVKKITLGEAAMRSLWRQVKGKLREIRRETAQIAAQSWRENMSNVGLGWSPDEDEALVKEYDAGKSVLDLMRIHKRSQRAIELRLEKFGKIQPPNVQPPVGKKVFYNIESGDGGQELV